MPRIRFFPRLFNKTVVAESSTAAHFAEGYEDAFAGTAEDEFYGIPLSNDLSVASFGDKFGLFLLLLAIIYVKPRIDVLNRRPELSRAFWIAVLAASYSLRELTWIPLLTTVVYTRTTYPYLVVLPHCIAAAASYRTERAQRPGSGALHWLPSFAFGFFCYGFGGSIVSDLLMGLPITALGHARIDLFKVDIEGYEWPMFESWPLLSEKKSPDTVLPMQVLVEVHYQTQMPELSDKNRAEFKWSNDMIRMQERFLRMGYAVVVRDDNKHCPHCTELTLVRIRCPPPPPASVER